MKITIDIGLDDILEEVEDYESGLTYFQYKDERTLANDVEEMIKAEIFNRFDEYTYSYDYKDTVSNFLDDHKDEIINRVVDLVSKKIINQKAIKDFKKSLDD